jgi:hypothetical protein
MIGGVRRRCSCSDGRSGKLGGASADTTECRCCEHEVIRITPEECIQLLPYCNFSRHFLYVPNWCTKSKRQHMDQANSDRGAEALTGSRPLKLFPEAGLSSLSFNLNGRRQRSHCLMSFLRFATRTARVQVRYFGTSSCGPTKSSNLPLYLSGAGLVGLTAYLYLSGSPTPFTSPVASSPTKPKQEKSALDAERFLDLKLKAVVPYNHNTARFIFELPNSGAALSPVTSLVVVRASEGAAGAPVDKKGNLAVRAYTPISSPAQEGELVLLIKKYENGVISKYVHEQLKPGDTLSIKGPISKFPYKGTSVSSKLQLAHSPLLCLTVAEIELQPMSLSMSRSSAAVRASRRYTNYSTTRSMTLRIRRASRCSLPM